MPGRSNAADLGQRLSHRLIGDVAEELRSARLSSGLTQAQVGAAIGVDRERVSVVERRRSRVMTVEQVTRQAAALGLRMSIKFYPVADPIRDVAQVRYIRTFLGRVGQSWRVHLDVPIPLPGDLRAIDIVLTGVCVIAVEVVTRLRDIQSTIREAQLKQRDLGAARLVIVVAATHANRRAISEARAVLGPAFDLDSQRVFRALALGEDPGRDALIVLE